jgi:hypothetical protein
MEHYIKGVKYRWEITDDYGWGMSVKGLRKIKLDKLNNKSDLKGYLLSISLKRVDDIWKSITIFYSYNDMLLRIEGKYFKCNNLEAAEFIIDSLIGGGQYVVFEKNMI